MRLTAVTGRAAEAFDVVGAAVLAPDETEQLARAARTAGPSIEADRLLAEILSYRGRTGEAAQILPDEPPAGQQDHAAWAVTRADTLLLGRR